MYKVAAILRYRNGVDRNEADRAWAERQGPLTLEVPGIVRYEQNRVTGPLPTLSGSGQEKVFFDGYASYWFADRDAFASAARSDQWRVLLEAGEAIFDATWVRGMTGAVEERVIQEGPKTSYKVVWLGRYKAGMDQRDASAYWTNTHGQLMLKARPKVVRYVQNHLIEPIGPDGPADVRVGFDGFSEGWYDDRDAFVTSIGTPEFATLIADGYNVFEQGDMWGAAIREDVVTTDGTLP